MEPLPQNIFARGNFRDGIRMDHVGATRQRLAESDGEILGSRFQRKVLVAKRGCAAILGDGFDDHGQIVSIPGAVRDRD